MRALLLVLAAAPVAGPPQEPAQDAAALLGSGALLELTLPHPPGARAEWFRLDLPPAKGEEGVVPAGPADPIGLVRHRFVVEPGGAYRLERETLFLDARTRVLHVEELDPDALTLVWREIGARHGRTVLVEWDRESDALRCSDTGGGEVKRREIDAPGGVLMPLYLLEKLRAGHLSAGRFRCFRPIAAELEQLELSLLPPGPFGFPRARVLEWRRADGALAGRFAFEGRKLVAFRWQEGGPTARAIGEKEYDRLRARLWSDPAGG